MKARKKTNRKPKSSPARKRRLARKQSNGLNFEKLEARQLLAAITVSNATDVLSPTADTSSITALIANDGGDGISLREAITAANNTTGQDTVTFDAGVFTGGENNLIRLTQGELSISDSNLSINGSFVGGVVITGDADGDDITFPDTHITDVAASYGGTAGAADDLLDDNSRVLNSSASSGDLTLTGLAITGGRSTAFNASGGGIFFSSGSGTLWLNQSTVSGNSTAGRSADGGGVFSRGDVLSNNSTVSSNSSNGSGGGISTIANGNVSLNYSTVSGNVARNLISGSGGGIHTTDGNVSLINSTVSGNSARVTIFNSGGGISTYRGDISLINSTVSDNSATGLDASGGGIGTRAGGISLTNSTVSGNSTDGFGGGVRAGVGDNLSLTNSTVSGNIADDGGGLWSAGSTVLLINSTVAGNSASGVGGGIGQSSTPGERLTIRNSIVAGNTDNGTAPDSESVGFLVVQHSLIGDTTGSGITVSTGAGNLLNQLPLLGPLADNGGLTQTHAPLQGSRAINSGSNVIANAAGVTTDQRGEDRIQFGKVDIGAVEKSDLVLTVTQIADENDPSDLNINTFDLNDLSLREAIALTNTTPTVDSIIFDLPGAVGVSQVITVDSQITISSSVTIDGSGANLLTIDAQGGGDNVLDGNGFRIFEVNDGNVSNSIDVSIRGLTLTGGDNSDSGGAIKNFENLTLDRVAIVGNRAGFGGGLRNNFTGVLTLSNSTIANNEADQNGGGISTGGALAATNVTISGNSATGNGGAIITAGNSSGASLKLTHSTLTNNTGISGVHFNSFLGPTIAAFNNTIIDSSITGVGDNGTTLSGGNNLFASPNPGITGNGNLFSQTSMLGPLADNGGSTLTHGLLPGSPAIGAGSNALALDENGNLLTTDQRGQVRIDIGTNGIGTVDIGALETEARSLVVTMTQDVEDPLDGFTSLREAIVFSNEGVTNDTITFDSSVFNAQTTINLSSQLPTIAGDLTIEGPGANLLTIDAQGGGDNVLDGNGFRIFEVNDGSVSNSVDVSISGLTLTGGDNNDSGGAIDNFENLTLDRVAIVDNRARFGGGLSNNLSGVLTLANSTIANNEASQNGGGISTRGALTTTNVTISGNSAVGNGGAIITAGDSSGSTLKLTQSTLTNNTGNDGVHFNSFNGPTIATFNNTIIDSSITGVGDNGTTLAGGNNLFASADPGILGTGNLFSQASTLGPLADNGGSTLTHALLPASPAINTGSNALALDENGNLLATDQRGEVRRFGTVDIGAFESELDEVRSLVVTTTQDVEDPLDGLTSLRDAIAFASDPFAGVNNDGDADGDGLVADTITFDASVFTGGDNSLIRLTQGELVINSGLSIDGSSVGGVVITGDVDDDDITVAGTNITDVSASFGGTAGASDDLLDDNSRVLNFLGVGNLTLTGLTITGGRISGAGGGINSNSGNVSLANSTVSGNSSAGAGGGIRTISGDVSLADSTVSENVSVLSGGGIFTSSGDVSLTNSTVSGNSSGSDGGGIWSDDSTVRLVNSTVTGNAASRVGGGISLFADNFSDDERLTVHNSIVAGNSDNGTAPDVLAVGDVMNDLIVEHSLIGDTTGSGITAATGTGNILNQSALLGPLADNGGPALTHALLPDSPAIDLGSNALAVDKNGSPLTTDQRGQARIESGTVDIGAVEFDIDEPFLLGDVNQDGVVNFLDISPFISLLSGGNFLDEADINRDGDVDFLDISPLISLLSTGGTSQTLLGDANLNGVVNFLDIPPFISLLSGGNFLDQADTNQDGNVNFLDISPFISLLASGGSAQSNQVTSSSVAPAISNGSFVTSQAIVVAAPVSSAVSLVSVVEPKPIALVASAVEVPVTNETAFAQDSALEAATVRQTVDAVKPAAQEALDSVNDSLSSTVARAGLLRPEDTSLAGIKPVDTYIDTVLISPFTYRFLGARNSTLRSTEINGPRSPTWKAESLDLSHETRDKQSSASVSVEKSFSTAAELFDAHPDSLDQVFDLELEKTFAGLIKGHKLF